MRMASELTVATTSPVGTRRPRASPASAAWWPMSRAVRKAPRIQLATAYLCRKAPDTALSTTRPSSTAAPEDERAGVAADDAGVDGPAHRGGEEGLADHPDDPEADGDGEGGQLRPADPPQVGHRAREVGVAGVGEGESGHSLNGTSRRGRSHLVFGGARRHRAMLGPHVDLRSKRVTAGAVQKVVKVFFATKKPCFVAESAHVMPTFSLRQLTVPPGVPAREP